mgnify:CR=1 FL=1
MMTRGAAREVISVEETKGTCVVCGLPQNHPAAPPTADGATEGTFEFVRKDGSFTAHPTCWRMFHAAQSFAMYGVDKA